MDLLLQLIEKEKMEITEVSLAEVTDQYLDHLDKMEDKNPEDLADFLVIAARLLYLKSKALLPYLEAEEEIDDLEQQLKMYKQFIDASRKINEMILQKRFSFSRRKQITKTEVEFSPPKKLRVNDLRDTFMVVLKRLDPLVKMPRQMIERAVSLQQKVSEIRDFLKKQGQFGFNTIKQSAKNKTEIIVNFLALLELLKKQQIKIKQNKTFEDIIITAD